MKDQPMVLIVEDQVGEREAMSRLFRLERFRVRTACNVAEALAQIGEPIDVVVSDLRMGERGGIDLLQDWRRHRPSTPFILVSAYAEVPTAVQAMKLGATDFLTKPVDPTQLLRMVRTIVERRPKTGGPRPERFRGPPGFERLIGRSPELADVIDRARRAAVTDSLVLILGESGTGKELIADAVHRNSRRKDGPYVAVNIAAIPEALVESELFGHCKGSFTGANFDRPGRFAAAQRGTLFVDEIGDFELSVQAKLLRVLESRTFSPVGSNEELQADVRVVAATSRDLQQLVASGDFRDDLYYRLNVVALQLPPLRERRDDIPLLVDAFLHEFAESVGRGPLEVDPTLAAFLVDYRWPGNVRQLRNTLESMVVMARGDRLTLDDLPPQLRAKPDQYVEELAPPQRDATLEGLEKTAVLEALRRKAGNRTHAAADLGISVRTLQRKLKLWGLASGSDAGP